MTMKIFPRVRVVLADPPWQHSDRLGSRGAAANYTTNNVETICHQLEKEKVKLHEDAVLFMWRLSSMPFEALDVVQSWGFKPHSEIVWNKLTKTGKPWFGMGRIVRGAHETCLIATRGKVLQHLKTKSVRSSFSAVVPYDENGKVVHSGKPDVFYEVVESLFPGPYFEMYARYKRPGWIQRGDQLTC